MSNGTLLTNKSGLIKERTKTSTERGIGCRRNGYWQRPIICQPIKELSSAAGPCAGRGYALIRQLAHDDDDGDDNDNDNK